MTTPKRWPNNAQAARKSAVMKAALIEKLVEPLLNGNLPEAERLRRYGQIESAALKIELELGRYAESDEDGTRD